MKEKALIDMQIKYFIEWKFHFILILRFRQKLRISLHFNFAVIEQKYGFWDILISQSKEKLKQK